MVQINAERQQLVQRFDAGHDQVTDVIIEERVEGLIQQRQITVIEQHLGQVGFADFYGGRLREVLDIEIDSPLVGEDLESVPYQQKLVVISVALSF